MDVHPPHHAILTWREFFIHMATIVLGLLIAIGLEQSVEWVHHRHQREQLERDLQDEAAHNQQLIRHDLELTQLEGWFDNTIGQVKLQEGQPRVSFVTTPLPCLPGTMGTSQTRYFAPSEAVWTTAKESGMAALLPPERARIYARLEHNDDLLAAVRDKTANACDVMSSMRRRFGVRSADGRSLTWTVNPAQAESLATAASQVDIGLRGMAFRLRWTLLYEDAIARGGQLPDVKMLQMNQELFEDPESGMAQDADPR